MIDLGSAVHGGGQGSGGGLERRHPRGGPVLAARFGRGASPCREFVARWACPDHLVESQEARLLVSELVTNAVVLGAGPIDYGAMRRDPRGHRRHRRWPATTGHSGEGSRSRRAGRRGLWMLVTLADEWGIRADADTKTIWFAMAQRSPDLTEPLGWSTRLAGMNCRTAASPRR